MKCDSSSDISTDVHEQVQEYVQIHNSSLMRFEVGGEHDVESVDEQSFDVCPGKGPDESHIEGSQDVGSFVG